MRRLAAALAISIAAAGSASASGSLECTAPDADVSVKLTIGSLPVLAVVGAEIEANGARWALDGDGESAIAVGQAFRDRGALRVDFTDPNVERVVAELRLFSAAEERNMATAGTLRITGEGAWALTCTGP
ncbi:hypothetical protein [Chelativorans sp. M5D2P16]|uniref:hypothetical protein n=1 Tax=Chelativorans sp. M5D2P16 TaxID=3095678 RepID=UPI002ACA01EB|nr:hypothetical protein [Chelativorans sp. M5D2P16]MDZ5696444.1 hypothetical protein [Chelativorans sp. M5D2P16]